MPTKPISIRIDTELLDRLTARAEQEHRTLSNLTTSILADSMKPQGEKMSKKQNGKIYAPGIDYVDDSDRVIFEYQRICRPDLTRGEAKLLEDFLFFMTHDRDWLEAEGTNNEKN